MIRRGRARLRRAAARILAAGLQAADPEVVVARTLQLRGRSLRVGRARYALQNGRLFLVAAGKAAARMARAAERRLEGLPFADTLVVDSSESVHLERCRLVVAGHPTPDRRGAMAGRRLERIALSMNGDDLLLLLLSGGASAMLPAPAEGLTLRDKQLVGDALLRSGAPIQQINVVRRHLSRLKGGRLARLAAPGRVACLAISDVVGDAPETIASGPVSPDAATFGDAIAVLQRRVPGRRVPARVRAYLEAGARGAHAETVKPGDPTLERVSYTVIAGHARTAQAAAHEARQLGLVTEILTTRLAGEAREVATVLSAVLADRAHRARRPFCLLAAGETTVSVAGKGRGGPNQELVASAAGPLGGMPAAAVLAALATDGIDGTGPGAGGIADDTSGERALRLGLAPAEWFLDRNDSHAFLAPLGDVIETGPTGTNVGDLIAMLAEPVGSPAGARL